jgi:hypothetical protein
VHDSVRDAWVDYNEGLEGKLTGLYADVLGLVTTGMGNKVDPVEDALALPFYVLPSRRPATHGEILAAWHAVKDDPKCAKLGHKYALALPANNVRLPDDAVDALINQRLNFNDSLLRKKFPDFPVWPADAQMATHSMVWAMGFARMMKKFPKCCRHLELGDFVGAANECKMVPEEGSLVTRNRLNFTLFHNASDCVAAGGNIECLIWHP